MRTYISTHFKLGPVFILAFQLLFGSIKQINFKYSSFLLFEFTESSDDIVIKIFSMKKSLESHRGSLTLLI